MVNKIIKTIKIDAGLEAIQLPINCSSFLIQNLSADKKVYFKEYANNGISATANNSFSIAPGETFDKVLTCEILSLVAEADNVDIRLCFVEVY